MTKITTPYDTAWKKILERYFRSFMEFVLPDVALDIDWNKPCQFLDKELLLFQKEAEVGNKKSDKLVQVTRNDGLQTLVIIHIEIQGDEQKGFAERMFQYYYRLYDKYKMPLMCLAILTDNNPNWRATQFCQVLWNCEISLRYPIVKLLDYTIEELTDSRSPIAKIFEAHLIALKTKGNPDLRFADKLRLVKSLYHIGYSSMDVNILYQFVHLVLELPMILEKQMMKELKHHEEEIEKPFIWPAEQMWFDEGKLEGKLEEKQKALKQIHSMLQVILEQRFGSLPLKYLKLLERVESQECNSLVKLALNANSLEDIFEKSPEAQPLL